MMEYYKVSYRHEGCPEIQTISATGRSKQEAKTKALIYLSGKMIQIVGIKKVSLSEII